MKWPIALIPAAMQCRPTYELISKCLVGLRRMLGLQSLLGSCDGNCKLVPDLLERRSRYEMKLKQATDQKLGVFRGCQELPKNRAVEFARGRFYATSRVFSCTCKLTHVEFVPLHVLYSSLSSVKVLTSRVDSDLVICRCRICPSLAKQIRNAPATNLLRVEDA